MDYFVTTQGLENYGAHCESGKYADGTQCWKFKSGTDYIVSGFDRPQDAMAFVAAKFIENNIYFKEFPVEVISHEDWQTELNDLDEDYREFLVEQAIACSPVAEAA